jgi:DNA polymerase sigma
LASCKLLKGYVARYACLKEVAVLLKLFLADHDLNIPYQGKTNLITRQCY